MALKLRDKHPRTICRAQDKVADLMFLRGKTVEELLAEDVLLDCEITHKIVSIRVPHTWSCREDGTPILIEHPDRIEEFDVMTMRFKGIEYDVIVPFSKNIDSADVVRNPSLLLNMQFHINRKYNVTRDVLGNYSKYTGPYYVSLGRKSEFPIGKLPDLNF